MKTAEELALKNIPQRYRSKVIELLKLYGTSVAEQSLKDAAKQAKVLATKGDQKEVSKTVHPHFDGWSVTVDEESISSTPILTP